MNNLEIASQLLFLMIISHFIRNIVVDLLESQHCIERVISKVFPYITHKTTVNGQSHSQNEEHDFIETSEKDSMFGGINNTWLQKRTRLLDKWCLS
jgi:hypothetical protein